MTTSTNGDNVDRIGSSIDIAMVEVEFRKQKAKAKSNFTQARSNLLLMVKCQNLPSRSGIWDACHNIDMCMEIVMELLSNFTTIYIKSKEVQKANVVVNEMEKIERDFTATYEIALAYLESREDDKSRVIPDSLLIDLERRNLVNEDAKTDTYRKPQEITSNQTFKQVGTLDQNNIRESIDKTRTTSCNSTQTQNNSGNTPGDMSVDHVTSNHSPGAGLKYSENVENPNRNAGIFVPTDGFATPNIGHDMWTQLKPVPIPTFTGDKRSYPSWKAAFMACVDRAPVTPEYKMLQLRQYISGEALNAIENLGFSPTAYEAAKDRLERKYGGKRRQKAVFMEDLMQFPQIQSGNAEELERFADLLDITIINLKETGEHQDLGDGSLYIQLQRKLPQSLLARYHRWLFENNVLESVVALQTWVIQESYFHTIASETIHGLTGQTPNSQLTQSTPNSVGERTFFISTSACQPQQIQPCQVCGEQHRIWQCKAFMQENISERWNIAKRFKLCYRCLAEGHNGKSCRRTRRCGKNGCHKVHHKLLHLHKETGRSAGFEAKSNTGPCNTDLQHRRQRPEAPCSSNLFFGTEGNRCTEQGTNIACTHFARGEMKVNDMRSCSRLSELRETEDVLSGNTRSVNTFDGQTLSSKVEASLSSETQIPYWTNLPQKCTFLRRGTSHTISPERRDCGHITGTWNTSTDKLIPHQHIEKFQHTTQTSGHPLPRDYTNNHVVTSHQGGLSRNTKRQTDNFGRQVQAGYCLFAENF